MNHRHIVWLACLATFMAYSTWLGAYSDDSSKPISIKADSAEIDDTTGTSTYRGNVRVTQGSMLLTGDKVVLKADNKKVQKIISEGSLSTFKQTTDDGKTVHAEAEIMVYNISKKEITLTRNAKLTEAGNTFASDNIVFHVDKKTVRGGNPAGNKRVNITVLPETVTGETPAETSP